MLTEPPGNDANLMKPEGEADGESVASATVERHGDLGRITLAGEFDLYTRQVLAAGLDPLFDGGRIKRLEVDAANVGFIDSAGIKALLALHSAAGSLGISFCLSKTSPNVSRALHLTGLADLLMANGSAPSA